jgi:S-formylglutathione hydrolase FrmB
MSRPEKVAPPTAVVTPRRDYGESSRGLYAEQYLGSDESHAWKQNPPNPPLQKGGFPWGSSQANDYLPPFLKGDRGGFFCAAVFFKTTVVYSLYKHS